MENQRPEDKYFLKRFERDIQIIFNEVSKSSLFHKVNIFKANKNLKCDYFIPLQSSEFLRKNIDLIVEKMQNISYILDAGKDSNFNLTLKLKRNMMFAAVLGEISVESDRYGYLNKNKSVLVLLNFVGFKSLDNKRNSLLSEHVVSVLANNGLKVFHDFQTDRFLDQSHITRLACTDVCSLDAVSKELKDELEMSEYKCEIEDNKLSIDLKRFIIEKNLEPTYGNSVSRIVLPNNSMSGVLENTCLIKHLLKDHIKYSPDVILHIGSQGQNKNILESGVLLNMLGYSSSQVYLFSHSVNYKSAEGTETSSQICSLENSDLVHPEAKCVMESNFQNDTVTKMQGSEDLAEKFVKSYRQVIENSTAMKYESFDPSHESWSSRIQSLTDAAVKFDFLTQSYSVNLVLLPPSESGSPKTSGVFIQYNHARLSNIFRNFEAMVSDGTYAPLCSLDSADLTLLSHEVEWQLINILASFPQMVEEVVDSLLGEGGKGRIHTGRIPGMLRELCRLLSLYYGKVRVLCGPQMQRHVHARMWLMKGVHQVLHNGLVLMNIKGMDLM